MVALYVLNVPEFTPIVDAARLLPDCDVHDLGTGYYRIESPVEIVLDRREMGMKPAVWYGLFTGGMAGEIAEFGRDKVRVIGTNKPL